VRRIRNFVFSFWGLVLLGVIVLFWICVLAVVVFGPHTVVES
jgi:hypothetical protein